MRDDVPRFGFKARIKDRYLFEIAKECMTLAHAGLRRRNRVDHIGRDESRHLEPLHRIIDSGRTPAEEMLEKFHGAWRGSLLTLRRLSRCHPLGRAGVDPVPAPSSPEPRNT